MQKACGGKRGLILILANWQFCVCLKQNQSKCPVCLIHIHGPNSHPFTWYLSRPFHLCLPLFLNAGCSVQEMNMNALAIECDDDYIIIYLPISLLYYTWMFICMFRPGPTLKEMFNTWWHLNIDEGMNTIGRQHYPLWSTIIVIQLWVIHWSIHFCAWSYIMCEDSCRVITDGMC